MHIFPHCAHTVIKFLTVLSKTLALLHLPSFLLASSHMIKRMLNRWTNHRVASQQSSMTFWNDHFIVSPLSVFFCFCPLVFRTGHNQRLFMKYFIIYVYFAVATFDQLANDARETSTLTITNLRKLYVKPRAKNRRWSISDRWRWTARQTDWTIVRVWYSMVLTPINTYSITYT